MVAHHGKSRGRRLLGSYLALFSMNELENIRQVVNNRFNECVKHATGCTELSG